MSRQSKSAVLYHVTKTSSVPRIKKLGIVPGQRSNWVQRGSGRRYGKKGEIFAFEHLADAVRWAAKWDWEAHTNVGSGKISIIEFLSTPSEWEMDTADPLGQAGRLGRWLKSTTRVPSDQILSVVPATQQLILKKRKEWMP